MTQITKLNTRQQFYEEITKRVDMLRLQVLFKEGTEEENIDLVRFLDAFECVMRHMEEKDRRQPHGLTPLSLYKEVGL